MKEKVRKVIVGVAEHKLTVVEAIDKIIELADEQEKERQKRNLVPFVMTGMKEEFQTVLIVDFKHQITDKVVAGIHRDLATQLPIIKIYEGKLKGRAFKLDSKSVMQIIEKLIKE